MKEKERKRDLDFERFLLTNPIYNVRMFVRIGNNEEEFDKFYSIETSVRSADLFSMRPDGYSYQRIFLEILFFALHPALFELRQRSRDRARFVEEEKNALT